MFALVFLTFQQSITKAQHQKTKKQLLIVHVLLSNDNKILFKTKVNGKDTAKMIIPRISFVKQLIIMKLLVIDSTVNIQ